MLKHFVFDKLSDKKNRLSRDPRHTLNADRTVSMTAALLCGAGASPVHKDRGCSADHDQIEDHAHAQRHAWEMWLWLKNGAHGRRARLARARRPYSRMSEVASTFVQGLPVVYKLGENHFSYVFIVENARQSHTCWALREVNREATASKSNGKTGFESSCFALLSYKRCHSII